MLLQLCCSKGHTFIEYDTSALLEDLLKIEQMSIQSGIENRILIFTEIPRPTSEWGLEDLLKIEQCPFKRN